MKRQLVSGAEAERVRKQPRTICPDCPFSRLSLPGWLGNEPSPDRWMQMAHSETRLECHTRVKGDGVGVECVGAAVYRANVCKRLRDPAALRMPADRDLVFATPDEFKAHHGADAMIKNKRLNEWTDRIDDLIDEFPNELFIELCEEMEDRAKTAREARIKEMGDDD